MSRRQRAALLLGLALLLGTLAASDVAGREAALRRALGPTVPVVVVRARVPAGARLDPSRLSLRRVPARYAPAAGYASVAALSGARAAIDLTPGEDLVPSAVADPTAAVGAPVRPGERVAEIVARGAPELVRPGGRVDVLVTRERGDGAGATTLALEDAEVLAAAPAAPEAADRAAGSRVAVSLRVTVRQAVYLAAAEAFARELRVLPRARGDRRHGVAGTTVGADLRCACSATCPRASADLKAPWGRPIPLAEALMLPTLRTLSIVLAATGLLAPAAANATVSKKTVYPSVSSISPRKLAIGETLTIKGKNLRAGRVKTTVVFQRSGKPAVFVKANASTTSRLVIRVPEKLAAFLLVDDKGAAKPTAFRLRILTTRFAKGWTSVSRSPVISVKAVAAGGTTTPGSGTPAPPALTPYEQCQLDAAANPAADADNDGMTNGTELGLVNKTDPCNADTDADGMLDGYEYFSAIDLNANTTVPPYPYPGKRPWPNPLDGTDGAFDFDGDGLTLSQEFQLWKFAGGTFPLTAYSDGTQNTGGTHAPTAGEFALDLDGDGNLTDDERDADGDGLSNWVEFNGSGTQTWWEKAWKDEKPYTWAKFAEPSAVDADTDGDGIPDGADDQDHDGWTNLQEMQYPGRGNGFRIQPYNPCLPNPYSLTCGRYIPFDNPWPPFDTTQGLGDAVPFQWPNAVAVAPDPGWNGKSGPQGV